MSTSEEPQSYSRVEEDCAVCLQKCHHPAQLPCGHIFCFLCVKGVAIQNKRCAMCRAEIPTDYLDHPVLLKKLTISRNVHETEIEGYQWYYEGRNGWWKYDERSNEELETAFNAGESECVLLLAGSVYCINFENMMQHKRNDHSRRRRVKRDTPLLPAKGIAGIKIVDDSNTEGQKEDSGSEGEVSADSAAAPSPPPPPPGEDTARGDVTQGINDDADHVAHLFNSMNLDPSDRSNTYYGEADQED